MTDFYTVLGGLETDAPPLSEPEAARIAARVKQRAGKARSRKRVLILLIAALLALTACAAATGAFSSWFRLMAPQNATDAQTQALFSGMGTVVGQSVTDPESGVTATLDGVLCDGYEIAVAVTFSGDNLDLDAFQTCLVSESMSSSWLIDQDRYNNALHWLEEQGIEDPEQAMKDSYLIFSQLRFQRDFQAQADGKLHLIFRRELRSPTSDPLIGTYEMLLHLENIDHGSEVLLPGTWEFTFPVQVSDTMLEYDCSFPVETESGTVTVTAVQITPFTLRVHFLGEQQDPEEDFDPPDLSHYRLDDGSEHIGSSGGSAVYFGEEGSGQPVEGWIYSSGDRAIFPGDVTAVQIDDTWLDLTGLTSNSAS